MMEIIVFLITIALGVSTLRQFKTGNKFGTAFTLISFLTFLLVDFIIVYEMFKTTA